MVMTHTETLKLKGQLIRKIELKQTDTNDWFSFLANAVDKEWPGRPAYKLVCTLYIAPRHVYV